MIALGGLRQRAVGGRFDFQPSVARLMPGAWIVVTDMWRGIHIAAAINRRGYMPALGKAPVAFDNCVGRVDAVNDNGYAEAPGNDEHRTAIGPGRGCRSDQNGQC